MSIQRYTEEPFAAFVKNDDGDFVKYSDHEAELHNLLSTLADIRTALGVGGKPMLGELAGIIREVRVQADRGGVKIAEWRQKASVLNRAMCLWRGMYREFKLILNVVREMNVERAEETEAETAWLKHERDEAVEALRFYANNETLVLMQDGGQQARAALAKIGGGRNA